MSNPVNVGPGGTVDLDHLFTYHPPTPDQIEVYQRLREAGKDLAVLIGDLVPSSPERSTAIAKVRESVMWANAGIACARPTERTPE